jgi:hypothetical protein
MDINKIVKQIKLKRTLARSLVNIIGAVRFQKTCKTCEKQFEYGSDEFFKNKPIWIANERGYCSTECDVKMIFQHK